MQRIFSPKNFTLASLFFLLAWRFLYSIAIRWPEKIVLPDWEEYAFLCISYVLISATLWANKSNLYEINVDKNFIILFITLGIIYSFLTPLVIGVLLGVTAILNASVFFFSKSRYAKNELSNTDLAAFLLILLVLDFIYFIVIQKAKLFMGSMTFIDAVFWANPPFLVAEEFLFRGLLWKLLRDFELSDNKIIYIQAFLFWLCHFYLEPIIFWIFVPLISILFGYLISRARSITPGIFLHFMHNFLSFILRY